MIAPCVCGEKPHLIHTVVGNQIRCPSCGMETYGYKTSEHAVNAWEKGHRHRDAPAISPVVMMAIESIPFMVRSSTDGATLYTVGCLTSLSFQEVRELIRDLEKVLPPTDMEGARG